MHKNIDTIAKSVLAELESRGYAQGTMSNFRHCANTLVKWVKKHCNGEFNTEAYEAYANHIYDMLQNAEMDRSYFNIKNRILKQFMACYEKKSIDTPYAFDAVQFKPSDKAMGIITAALEASSLTEKGKYKIAGLMRKFFCFTENQNIDFQDIHRETMVSFVSYVSKSNAGSMGYVVRMLKTLADYLVSIDIMPIRPDFSFIVPKHAPQKLIPPFLEQELSKVLGNIDTTSPKGKRDFAAVLLAIGTGLRAGDIVQLQLSDILWKTQEILIFQGKTGVPLKMPVSGQICNAIADYILYGRPQSDCKTIFLRSRAPYIALRGSALTHVLDRICATVGVEKKAWRSFHSLRRTYGTWLAGESVQLPTISQMMGHSEINSSKPYLSFDDTQLSACAMGFEDIPLKGGTFSGVQGAHDPAL